ADEFTTARNRQLIFAHAAGFLVPFDDAGIEAQCRDVAIGQYAAHGFVLVEFVRFSRTENIVAWYGRGHPVAEIAISLFEYVATCATSGGFIHMYTALDQNLFAKYGLSVRHVVFRTAANINLAALAIDEIQFLYCAADATIPGMAAGSDASLVASPLVGLPYLIIARKEIKTIQDLKGKSIGVGSVGGLPYRLLRAFVKKFGLVD